MKQVHSATVLVATTGGCVGEGDALVTDLPGLALAFERGLSAHLLVGPPKSGDRRGTLGLARNGCGRRDQRAQQDAGKLQNEPI
jgi:hypothetical protein